MRALLNEMSNKLAEAMVDAEKFDKGNKSAGTRVRTGMSAITKLAKQVREAVQEVRTNGN